MSIHKQTSLVLLHGGEKKCQLLRKEVTILGRGRGADVVLDAPDVSLIHCVIWRNHNGLCVRDCSSRTGTRINGEDIREATLYDGDILQIGSFSFGLELPPRNESVHISEKKLRRLRRSRANFARLAVTYRRRIMEQQPPPAAENDLHRKASVLRDRVRLFEKHLKKLQEKERELTREREHLEKERSLVLQWKKQLETKGHPAIP